MTDAHQNTAKDWSGLRICVAGSGGLLGAALTRTLTQAGAKVRGWRRADGDLRSPSAATALAKEGPFDVVFLIAATQGGLGAHIARPLAFGADNARIAANCIEAFARSGTPRLIYAASTAIYPGLRPVGAAPFAETDIGRGPPDAAHAPYAAAKMVGVSLCAAANAEFGLRYAPVLLGSLYGPGGAFDPENSTLIHGLIARAAEDRKQGNTHLNVWGTGAATRDVLYVDDAATGLMQIASSAQAAPINLASGSSHSVKVIASEIAEATGLDGLTFDPSRPEGAAERPIDISLARSLGFRPAVSLKDGIARTVAAYKNR